MIGWKTEKLGVIADMCLGKMLDKEKNKGVPHPYLGNINVRWGGFDFENLNQMRFESSEHDRYGLQAGDLVICEGGEPGRCALWKGQVAEMKIQKALHRVRVKNTHDAEFVFYRFLLAGKTGELEKHYIGSTIKHLTGLGLKEVEFAYPPKPVQKKIASVLSALDAKIELNNQINAELEAMAKLLYDYWFVQFDFPMTAAQAASLGRPALVGKPYKSSGGKMVHNKDLNQEIPKAWTVDVLQNLSSLIRRGVSPKYVEQGGISVLNQKCIRDQSIQFTEARRHGIELEESHDRLLQHLDVVVNSTGVGTLGRVAFVKRLNESKTTVDSHVTIVRANQKLVSPAYFVWSMLRLQPVIESAAVGSTGQVELSKTYLEQLNLVVPDGDTQSQFTEFATPVIQAIACREKQNQELTQLRDWLLPMLMNGQVTVGT